MVGQAGNRLPNLSFCKSLHSVLLREPARVGQEPIRLKGRLGSTGFLLHSSEPCVNYASGTCYREVSCAVESFSPPLPHPEYWHKCPPWRRSSPAYRGRGA